MTNEEKIIEYLNGDMEQGAKRDFELLLESDSSLRKLLEEYRLIFQSLDDINPIKPSDNLRSSVLAMLDKESESITRNKTTKWNWILVLGILFVISITGYYIISKNDTKNVSKKLPNHQLELNNNSVTGRIHAVSLNDDKNGGNNEVINTLIKVLDEDKSSNVRLATVKVMNQHIHNEMIRVALVNALGKEKDPFVLIEIINTLARNKEKSALGALEELTQENNLEKFIKDEAHLGIFQIQEY